MTKQKAKIDARVDDNGTSTTFTASGFGMGGHAATLRLIGPGTLDDTYPLTWDGDTVTKTVDKVAYTEGILTVAGAEQRFEVAPPS